MLLIKLNIDLFIPKLDFLHNVVLVFHCGRNIRKGFLQFGQATEQKLDLHKGTEIKEFTNN